MTLQEAMDDLRNGKLHATNPEAADKIAEEIKRLWYMADCLPSPEEPVCDCPTEWGHLTGCTALDRQS